MLPQSCYIPDWTFSEVNRETGEKRDEKQDGYECMRTPTGHVIAF